ncbi:MAG: MBL fold metallo-hydrolase [archaeon]
MVKITFYGGVDEIGGNKILVKAENGSILLDFGRRMGYAQDYFSEFLQTRSKNALRDLVRLKVLPEIDGIYAKNLVDATTLFENDTVAKKVPVDDAPDYWRMDDVSPYDPENPVVDAVFVSHAHFDHIQDVSFLDPKIPVYCTDVTKIIAKAMSDVSVCHVDDQFYEIRRKNIITQKSEGSRTLCPGECEYKEVKEDECPIIEDLKTKFSFTHEFTPQYRLFNTSLQGQIKDIKYEMIPVGHSLPGACSILLTIEPNGKRILYTGDLRFHGSNDISIDDYVAKVNGPVDVMITEGTRFDSDSILTEDDIGKEISSEIKEAEGLVLINFGWKDLSRFSLIYDAAKENDRIFIISPKLAYLLYEMHLNFPTKYADPRTMPNLKVYLKREGDALYSKADYDKFKMGYLHFHGRNSALTDRNLVRIAERLKIGGKVDNKKNPLPEISDGEPYDYQEIYDLATHHLTNGIPAYQIRKNPDKYVVMFSYWDANELFDLIPEDVDNHKTVYISASTEPFNEEMEIDETKLIKWLEYFKINYEPEIKDGKKIIARKHVSGHASKNELKDLIEKINPTMIVPIHTLNSKSFVDLFGDKVSLPEYEGTIEI